MSDCDLPTSDSLNALKRAFAATDVPEFVHEGDMRASAVLLPLIRREDAWQVIFTIRALHLENHPGQVCFPGGALQQGESLLDAALREAHEEIGLAPSQVDVLGALKPIKTTTGFLVMPYVGVVNDAFTPQLDHSEVAELFETPLSYVLDNDNMTAMQVEHNNQPIKIYHMNYDDKRIWGATAYIIIRLQRLFQAAIG